MAKIVNWMTVSFEDDGKKQGSFPCDKCGATVDVSAPVDRDPVKAPCPKCGNKHTLDGKKGGDFS